MPPDKPGRWIHKMTETQIEDIIWKAGRDWNAQISLFP
jgi:hypothetical protein